MHEKGFFVNAQESVLRIAVCYPTLLNISVPHTARTGLNLNHLIGLVITSDPRISTTEVISEHERLHGCHVQKTVKSTLAVTPVRLRCGSLRHGLRFVLLQPELATLRFFTVGLCRSKRHLLLVLVRHARLRTIRKSPSLAVDLPHS